MRVIAPVPVSMVRFAVFAISIAAVAKMRASFEVLNVDVAVMSIFSSVAPAVELAV